MTVFNGENANCDFNCESSVNDESRLQISGLNVLIPFYRANKYNVKFAHININSVRHKFDPLAEALAGNLVDMLMVQESKLDESFPPSQFTVLGFKS